MSSDLQGRIDDLRRQVQNLGEDAGADTIGQLERTARALLADAKNTPHETAAQALFGELARMSNPTSPTAATVRGLVRRARIRIEIAGDDDDIDEAIDILAEALALNPRDGDVIALLQEAANRSQQANQRVNDLFGRYGVQKPSPPAAPSAPPPAPAAPAREVYPSYPTSSGYPAPETQIFQDAPSPGRRPGQGPLYAGSDIDEALSELTQAYYAGDYQQTVDLANRILTQQPGNPTALEYRQKAEDNLIRGVVPDHRIPFDARVAYNRANSLVRAGNYEEAERLYREARDLAERSGILSWKDAEQALLEIQDLALARELLNEGDRLMATDNWSEALRKYEGALRVVPNDPVTEDRIETVRRVQQDADQAAMQLSMLSGSLQDQVLQLQNVTGILTRVRQRLPNSQRLNQLYQEANERLNGIKTYLNDQAQAALSRANGATSLEERLNLTNEALHLLELGVKLAPGDSSLSEMMLAARSGSSDMQRARQVIERASVLIAQNFDNELTQARSMLAGLRDYAQDERYRTVVSDLLARYVERAEQAIEDGDVGEAQSWLDALREEPFRILGRRSEVQRVENALRSMHQRGRARSIAVIIIIIMFVAFGILASRPVWLPVINPPPTATSSVTPTSSNTPTPSTTWTPTNTPTSSVTPSPTGSATPTYTPSWTVTPSLTPTDTPSPTHTPTITPTFTPSDTPTVTDTPTITPTQPVLCRVFVQNLEGVNVRSRPTTLVPRVGVIPRGTAMDVVRQELGPNDGRVWFFVYADIEGAVIQGWLRGDTVIEITDCPALP
jgi:tetratricopeptide (TPR) repeat protein